MATITWHIGHDLETTSHATSTWVMCFNSLRSGTTITCIHKLRVSDFLAVGIIPL